MGTLESEIEIREDGSITLLSPLPSWWKPGRAHVSMTVEPSSACGQPKLAKLSASPEMIARRAAALERIRDLDPYRDIDNPLAWQNEMREDRALPGRE